MISPCKFCQSVPDLQRSGSLCRYRCGTCSNTAGSSHSDEGAAANWNQLQQEQRPCIGCGNQPRLSVRFPTDTRLTLKCIGCGHMTAACETQQGAVTAWHRENDGQDALTRTLWRQYHTEQKA